MEDLGEHPEKMENASQRYGVVIQPAGRDDMVKEMWTETTGASLTLTPITSIT